MDLNKDMDTDTDWLLIYPSSSSRWIAKIDAWNCMTGFVLLQATEKEGGWRVL